MISGDSLMGALTNAWNRVTGGNTTKTATEEAMNQVEADQVAEKVIDELRERARQRDGDEVSLEESTRYTEMLSEDFEAMYRRGHRQGQLEEQERSEDADDIKNYVIVTLGAVVLDLFITAWPAIQKAVEASQGGG